MFLDIEACKGAQTPLAVGPDRDGGDSNMSVLLYILPSNLLIFQYARADKNIIELDDRNGINGFVCSS